MKEINEELLEAAKIGDKQKVEQLLEEGADVDAKDEDGKTALMFAAFMGHEEIVELLKSYGAKR
jgi:ankyrin repeat protein